MGRSGTFEEFIGRDRMMQPTIHIEENGDRHWLLNDKHHREDGPAIENSNGDKYWYINGESLTESEFDNHRFIKWVKDGMNNVL